MDDAPEMDWGALEPDKPVQTPEAQQPTPPKAEILPPVPQGPIAPNLNPLGLTEEEARFARTFVETGNLSAATRAAGLKGQGSMGRKILDRSHVAAEVARLAIGKGTDLVVVDEPLTITIDQVVTALFEISTASILDAYEQDGEGKLTVKRLDALPDNLKAAVKAVKQDANGSITLDLYSKMESLRMLMSFFDQRARKAPPKLLTPGEEPEEVVTHRDSVTVTRTTTLTYDRLVQQHGAAIASSLATP